MQISFFHPWPWGARSGVKDYECPRPPGYGPGPALLLALLLSLPVLFPAAAAGAAQAPLRVGVASMVTPVSAVRYYQEIVNYLGDKLGRPAEMVHRTTYDEVDRLLEQRRLDAAFICSAPYVLDRDQFGVELLAAPVVDGEPFYRSLIIVHRDSPAQRFEDLEGATFVFVDPKSNSGRLYPEYWLARRGRSPEEFFSRFFYSYSHNKSVELVAKRKADGAAVDSVVYRFMRENGSPYARATRVIHRSPAFGIPPVVVPADTPIFEKERLRSALLTMHQDPDGARILRAMRIERFVKVTDANYDLIRKMQRQVTAFRQRYRQNGHVGSTDANAVLGFAVTARHNPRLAYERYQPLVDYLAERLGRRLELVLGKDARDAALKVGTSQAAFALLDPLTYLDARLRFQVEPLARGRDRQGNASYRATVVVRAGSPVARLADLAGRRVAFADLWTAAGNLYPRIMLARSGLHLDGLAAYENFIYQETVVKKVLAGQFDAGAVRDEVAIQHARHGLRVLARSRPIPTGPVVAAADAPYRVVTGLRQILLAMDQDPVGRAVLSGLDADMQGGFLAAADSDYQAVRDLVNGVPQGCGRSCHPPARF